jgi:hypothetical protein
MTSVHKKNRKPHKKKLHKNALTKSHKLDVNSTKSGSLTHFEIFFGQEMIKVEK